MGFFVGARVGSTALLLVRHLERERERSKNSSCEEAGTEVRANYVIRFFVFFTVRKNMAC